MTGHNPFLLIQWACCSHHFSIRVKKCHSYLGHWHSAHQCSITELIGRYPAIHSSLLCVVKATSAAQNGISLWATTLWKLESKLISASVTYRYNFVPMNYARNIEFLNAWILILIIRHKDNFSLCWFYAYITIKKIIQWKVGIFNYNIGARIKWSRSIW